MLYLLFTDYQISYIKIAKDHQTHESFGYAFIGFNNITKAEEAMQKLNYSKHICHCELDSFPLLKTLLMRLMVILTNVISLAIA